MNQGSHEALNFSEFMQLDNVQNRERPFDVIRYSFERKWNQTRETYDYLQGQVGILTNSLRYYYTMLDQLHSVAENDESLVSFGFREPEERKNFRDLLVYESFGLCTYFADMAVLYGFAFFDGLSPSEERIFLHRGQNRGNDVFQLFQSLFPHRGDGMTELLHKQESWKQSEEVYGPDADILAPWKQQKEQQREYSVLGLTIHPREFYPTFLEEIKPLLKTIVGERNDLIIIGNVASGVFDAGIVTAAARKTLQNVRVSLALSRFSPIKEQDGAPHAFPYEQAVAQIAPTLNGSILVVDHFAYSGNTINTYLNHFPLPTNAVYCLIGSSDERIRWVSPHIEEVYFNPETNVGIYKKSDPSTPIHAQS